MLRSSILYACETYYNLKETEIRQLEMIEEGFLRELMKTGKGCPISQLYTEVSLIPARFEIIKLRLLFLQYILTQKEDSTIFMFLKLQFQQPTKGDWGSTCIQNLQELNIDESLEDIKLMTKQKFKNILNERIIKAAIIYLKGKQGSKGKEIEFCDIQMADYLLPSSGLLVEDQRKIFSIRNRMVKISNNFSSKNNVERCICGETENMSHIYTCNLFSHDKYEEITPYEKIYLDNVSNQVKVLRRFENQFSKREQVMNEYRSNPLNKSPPCDPMLDPLFSACKEYINGNG